MFKLVSKYKPSGDQPQAIDKLVKGIEICYNSMNCVFRSIIADE